MRGEVGDQATSWHVNASNVTCLYPHADKNHKLCAVGFGCRSERLKVLSAAAGFQTRQFSADSCVHSRLTAGAFFFIE